MSAQETALRWVISNRRVRVLCDENIIPGWYLQGALILDFSRRNKASIWAKNRPKQKPKQLLSCFSRIDALKDKFNDHRSLTQREIKRLREEFLVEYIYNSNAIEGNTLTLQ